MIALNKTNRLLPVLLTLGTLTVQLLCAAELNLETPAMKQIKESYSAARKVLDATRNKELTALIDQYTAAAQESLKEKTRAGNIPGMASARNAISIMETCKKDLDEKGDFSPPEQVRRELRAEMKAFATDKQEIDRRHEEALLALREKHEKLLAQQGPTQGLPDLSVDEISSFFNQLISTPEPGATPGAEPGGPNTGEAGTGDTNAPAIPLEKPRVIAATETGPTGTNWVTIARWFAGVSGIEIIRIPVMERTEREHKEVAASSPLSQPYEVTYDPVRKLSPAPGYAYRLKSLPGREVPDIVEWPSSRNKWTLQVRARPGGEVPSKHGVEIQVAFPGSEALPPLNDNDAKEDDEDDGTRVKVSIKTIPDGAFVYVDGQPYRDGGEFLKTPCVAPLRPGQRNIRLRKFGFKDAVVPEFDAKDGSVLNWRFEVDARTADETLKISASARTWQNSGVDAAKGDTIYLKATGEWHCGSGKELVSAEGYPNDKNFYRYYINPKESPRILAGAPYGCLIMRIGKDGPPQKIGAGGKFKADRDGDIYFDINEEQDIRLRRNNGGALELRLRKTPGF